MSETPIFPVRPGELTQPSFGPAVVQPSNSLKPVTRHDLDVMMAHILRVPEVLHQAQLKGLDNDFNEATELDHKLLYRLASDFYGKTGRMITSELMFMEIGKVASNPLYSDPQFVDGLFKLAGYCYFEFPANSLIAANAEQIMDDFLFDRRVINRMVGLVERGGICRDDWRQLQVEGNTAQLEAARIVEPFAMASEDVLGPLERQQLGVDVLDALMPGPRSGELYGFLAPTGGGKTTLSMQMSIALAKRHEHVAFFTYEDEPNKEYMVPVLACATGINRSRVEKIRNVDDFTPDEKRRYEEARQSIGRYLHIIDLSGSRTATAGRGGPPEIDSYLNRFEAQGIHISMFVLDWFWIMMRRYMSVYKRPKGDNMKQTLEDRTFAQTLVDELKMICRKRGCWGWVNQQLSPAVSASKKKKMGWQDAAEFKSFAWFLNGCFALTELDEHQMATLNYSKARSSKTGYIAVELKGEEARFVNRSQDMTWSDRQRKLVVKGKENAPPEENLPRDAQRQRAMYSGEDHQRLDL